MGASIPTIHGFCNPMFQAVGHAFKTNFAEHDELGAAVSIYHDGQLAVDLWAGTADAETGADWQHDTLVPVFSCTKGVAAICIHVLVERDLLAFDKPVAHYWPEFAANGKEGVTVAMVLSHQAGLPYWREPLPTGALTNWELATSRLAAQRPVWEPGTAHGYHGTTIGFLEGELVRRVTGTTIGHFLRDEVASPLQADVWIGLPALEADRVARVYLAQPDRNSALFRKISDEPDWEGCKLVTNTGGHNTSDFINSDERHAMENPAGGGLVTAQGLARLYAPFTLDGSLDGVRLVGPDALAPMKTARAASDCDIILRLPTTFTLGFSKCWGDRRLGPGEHVIIGEQAFGAPGMGGSIGFADPQAGMSLAYVMNLHGGGVGLNQRGQSIVDAAYEALGFIN